LSHKTTWVRQPTTWGGDVLAEKRRARCGQKGGPPLSSSLPREEKGDSPRTSEGGKISPKNAHYPKPGKKKKKKSLTPQEGERGKKRSFLLKLMAVVQPFYPMKKNGETGMSDQPAPRENSPNPR